MIILGQEALTRRRYAAGSVNSSGEFVAGANTDAPIVGSFQPLDGEELATLPMGERSLDQRMVLTETDLRVARQAEAIQADRVSQDGSVWYEVREVAYDRAVLVHYEARVVRVQETEG